MFNMTIGTTPTSEGYRIHSSSGIGQDMMSCLTYPKTKGTSLKITIQKGHKLNPPGFACHCWVNSDVLGWASSPEPAELSPFKPKPSLAPMRACNGLGL